MKRQWLADLYHYGRGIRYRSFLYRSAWKEHLQRTKLFIEKTLIAPAETLHVLGAGRLLDFPLHSLEHLYGEIHFYDADPGALKKLRAIRAPCQIYIHNVELTATLNTFEQDLGSLEYSPYSSPLESSLFKQPFPLNPLPLGKSADVISLNILSQLPLSYLSLFERWAKKQLGVNYSQMLGPDWIASFNRFGAKIIEQHLKALESTQAARILLISDTEQLTLPKGVRSLPRPEAQPFQWQIDGELKSPLELNSTLCDLDFRRSDLQHALLPSYEASTSDFWSWQLVPQSRWSSGTLSRVDAIAFTHSDR